MNDEPLTELDERFSDAGTQATTWAQARAVLEAAQISWISAVRADGRPHVTPLVAVWLDDALHFSTGPAEQKAVNLAANPHVVITTGTDTWDSGLDVMVEGTASRVTDAATLERLAAAWRTKWDGSWRFDVHDGAFRHPGGEGIAHVYAVHPARILAFGRRPYTHTRHLPRR
ncbi:Pyridoxamine 5'-phosphate oxidase [Frankia canadensis]|uniref:Pyridoxamine 5'-phosphate oxidase n=1 Tax=Frankia canadensis TaxID=1836972 RepID=A0A2I2KV32_9ACTN|nr:pyridoxamine 5'-phosphate oxidase family protein [Frankia canadensis]SNQ49518.1 Pyridoxamine 5'-phosphate oxidase [Frankia canadensis]SOU56808.1 Pyridoxamine 5'-phosphate oxidase [Frankia canadensis]